VLAKACEVVVLQDAFVVVAVVVLLVGLDDWCWWCVVVGCAVGDVVEDVEFAGEEVAIFADEGAPSVVRWDELVERGEDVVVVEERVFGGGVWGKECGGES
jgi:hypothetical protein